MTEIAERTPVLDLVAAVRSEKFKGEIGLALPDGKDGADRFARVLVTALLDNPEIAQAEHNSILQSALHCAKDGLLPDGREAALVVFGSKAVYMPMVAGYRKIAAEFGWAIRTQVVYENDTFDYVLGLEPRLDHKPARFGTPKGDPLGAYAVGTHKDGRVLVEVLDVDEIEKVRAVSRAKNSGPWKDWWERMAEKTAGRRLFAKLPLGERDSERVARVLEAADVSPVEAVYGPENGDHSRKTPDVIEASPHATAGDEGQHDAAAEVPSPLMADSPESPSAAALPPEGEQTTFTPPVEPTDDALAADAAGKFEVPRGDYGGKTLAQMAELGEKGVQRLAWMARNWGQEFPELDKAVLAYSKIYLPDLHAEITAERAA